MVPEWAERFLGEHGEAEHDPRSGLPVAWGREVVEEIPEDLFDTLRSRCEMSCVYPQWFLIEKRWHFSDILMTHGGVRAVGVGPGGGFKWLKVEDGTIWGHSSFRSGAIEWLERNQRLLVKCDKEGNEKGKAPRIPRVSIGRGRK